MEYRFISDKERADLLTNLARQAEADHVLHTANAEAYEASGNEPAADQQRQMANEAEARVNAAVADMPHVDAGSSDA